MNPVLTRMFSPFSPTGGESLQERSESRTESGDRDPVTVKSTTADHTEGDEREEEREEITSTVSTTEDPETTTTTPTPTPTPELPRSSDTKLRNYHQVLPLQLFAIM